MSMNKIKLSDTADMMKSSDYKERFRAEYYQLLIRYKKLNNMICKWDNNELNFTPTCRRELYDYQLKSMLEYLNVLRTRALKEKVDITDDIDIE